MCFVLQFSRSRTSALHFGATTKCGVSSGPRPVLSAPPPGRRGNVRARCMKISIKNKEYHRRAYAIEEKLRSNVHGNIVMQLTYYTYKSLQLMPEHIILVAPNWCTRAQSGCMPHLSRRRYARSNKHSLARTTFGSLRRRASLVYGKEKEHSGEKQNVEINGHLFIHDAPSPPAAASTSAMPPSTKHAEAHTRHADCTYCT